MTKSTFRIKPYRHSPTSSFVVEGPRVNGKRARKFFRSKGEAKTWIKNIEMKIASEGPSALALDLDKDQRNIYIDNEYSTTDRSFVKRFGANVSRERNLKGLSQEKFAELAKLNIHSLPRIEAGETTVLITTAERIRSALKCEWDKLF